MKKKISLLLAFCVLFSGYVLAEEDDDPELTVLEVVEEINLDDAWLFPVALEDLNPEFIRLANKHYLLSSDYVPDNLVKVPSKPSKGGISWAKQPKGGWLLQEECSEALCRMNADMRQVEGFRTMYLKSAYRSYRTQKTMYNNRLTKNNGRDDGWVSMPGASDHQTGLGCDVVPSNWRDKAMNDTMMKEPECQWMAEHCHEYGFIIRYPADKQDFTEIHTEPWHLRYVGIPAATYIMENGLCLEEFTIELQDAIQDYLDRGGDPEKVKAYIQIPTD